MFDLLEFVSLHMQLKFFMNLKFENNETNLTRFKFYASAGSLHTKKIF